MVTALQSRFPSGVNITTQSGCSGVACPDDKQFPSALAAAAAADLILLVVGLDGSVEGEGHDRQALPCNGQATSIFGLPGCQFALVESVTKAITPGQTVVMVLMHGGGVATPSEDVNNNIGRHILACVGHPHTGICFSPRCNFGHVLRRASRA